jgi:hypothetical protein
LKIVELAVCEWGINLKADQSQHWFSQTLEGASRGGHTEVVNFLLRGANIPHDRLDAAFCSAASNEYEETAEALINSVTTIDPFRYSDCPFEVAAKYCQISFLRFLVK